MGLLRIPPNPSAAGWVVDREAVEAALRELRIRYPLRVLLTTGWRKIGNANVDRYGHRIRLSGRHPLERASRTLWHELAHSAQRERELHGLARDFLAELGEEGQIFLMQIGGRRMMGLTDEEEADYRRGGPAHAEHPLEIEARQVAEKHTGELLLRPASKRTGKTD